MFLLFGESCVRLLLASLGFRFREKLHFQSPDNSRAAVLRTEEAPPMAMRRAVCLSRVYFTCTSDAFAAI